MTTMQAIIEQTDHLKKDYTIKNGRIQNPGKFESEMYYALYFYDCVMNGGGDEVIPSYYDHERVIDIFNLTYSEKQAFPELKTANRIFCQTDDNGFFYCNVRD